MDLLIDQLTLNRQIFCKQGLRASNDTLVDDRCQFDELLVTQFLFSLAGRAVSAANDRNLETLAKLGRCTENTPVDEMNERKVFEQIVLNRCA